MMNRFFVGAITAAMLLGTSSAVGAQAASVDSTHGLWLAGSLGAATTRPLLNDGDAVVALSGNLQRGPWVGSLRWQSLGNGFGSTEIRALSILLGRATTSTGFGFAAVSAGFTGLRRRDCTAFCGLFGDGPRELGPSHAGAGVILAGDAALRVGHKAGGSIGLTGYVDLNTSKSYAGIGLEIGLGAWR